MGWDQLLGIIREARAEARKPERLVACPNDGEPLRAGPHGLFCPFDGWKPGDDVADNAVR